MKENFRVVESRWFIGEGEPPTSVGQPGDKYIDRLTLRCYRNTSRWEFCNQADRWGTQDGAEHNFSIFIPTELKAVLASAESKAAKAGR